MYTINCAIVYDTSVLVYTLTNQRNVKPFAVTAVTYYKPFEQSHWLSQMDSYYKNIGCNAHRQLCTGAFHSLT